jgi:hypothetical protein
MMASYEEYTNRRIEEYRIIKGKKSNPDFNQFSKKINRISLEAV